MIRTRASGNGKFESRFNIDDRVSVDSRASPWTSMATEDSEYIVEAVIFESDKVRYRIMCLDSAGSRLFTMVSVDSFYVNPIKEI